jgi:hypothetical protein
MYPATRLLLAKRTTLRVTDKGNICHPELVEGSDTYPTEHSGVNLQSTHAHAKRGSVFWSFDKLRMTPWFFCELSEILYEACDRAALPLPKLNRIERHAVARLRLRVRAHDLELQRLDAGL